jgi:hypothetical protein
LFFAPNPTKNKHIYHVPEPTNQPKEKRERKIDT